MPLDKRTVVIGQDVLPKMRTCWGSQAHVRASFRNFCSALHAPSHDVLSEPQESANDETIQSVVFSYPTAFTASVTLTDDAEPYARVSYILPKITTEDDFDPLPPGGGIACGLPVERCTFTWPSNANYRIQTTQDDGSNYDPLDRTYLNATSTYPNTVDELSEFSGFTELTIMPGTEIGTNEVNNALALLVREVLCDQSLVAEDVIETIEVLIAKIDEKLSEQVNEILHNEEFRQLESAWRGLAYTLNNTEADASLRVKVLNISKAELSAMMRCYPGAKWDKSPLFNIICEENLGTLEDTPIGCLVGDYYFSHFSPDVSMLNWLGKAAEASRAPFIYGMAPELLGLDSSDEFPVLTDVEKLSSSELNFTYATIGDVDTSGIFNFASGGTIGNVVFDSPVKNRETVSLLLNPREPVAKGSANILEPETKYIVWNSLRIFGNDPDLLQQLLNCLSPVQVISNDLFAGSGFALPSPDFDGGNYHNGDGRNVLCSGLNSNKLIGEEGVDPLRGDLGTNRIYGGGGQDRLYGRTGNDDRMFDRFSFDTAAQPNKHSRRRIAQLEARQNKIKECTVTICGKVSSAGTKLHGRHFEALEAYLLESLHNISLVMDHLRSILPWYCVDLENSDIHRRNTWISEPEQRRTNEMHNPDLECTTSNAFKSKLRRSAFEPLFPQLSKSATSGKDIEQINCAKIRNLSKLGIWRRLILFCSGDDILFKQHKRSLEHICHALFKERAMPA